MKRSKAFLFLFAFSIISISLIFSAPYAWKSVIAGGGGFVDGIVFIQLSKILVMRARIWAEHTDGTAQPRPGPL